MIRREFASYKLPWPDGLMFELRGWDSTVIKRNGLQKFRREQSFPMDLGSPSPIFKTAFFFLDANYPQGFEVEINVGEIEPEGKRGIQPSSQTQKIDKKVKYPKINGAEEEAMIVSHEATFRITGSCLLSNGYAPSIGFDRTVLKLESAAGQDSVIGWNLTAIRTGNTPVMVNTYEKDTNTIKVKTYQVTIRNDSLLLGPLSSSFTAQTPPTSWLEFIDFGYSLIKREYPSSQLYEVQASSISKFERAYDPLDLCRIRIVCTVTNPGNKVLRTTMIQSTGWGSFGHVERLPTTWKGDEIIQWPVAMDIMESFDLLKRSNLSLFLREFKNCTLRYPSGPGFNQPYYIYTSPDSQIVGVGVNDKKARHFGTGNFSLLPVEESERVGGTQSHKGGNFQKAGEGSSTKQLQDAQEGGEPKG